MINMYGPPGEGCGSYQCYINRYDLPGEGCVSYQYHMYGPPGEGCGSYQCYINRYDLPGEGCGSYQCYIYCTLNYGERDLTYANVLYYVYDFSQSTKRQTLLIQFYLSPKMNSSNHVVKQ